MVVELLAGQSSSSCDGRMRRWRRDSDAAVSSCGMWLLLSLVLVAQQLSSGLIEAHVVEKEKQGEWKMNKLCPVSGGCRD